MRAAPAVQVQLGPDRGWLLFGRCIAAATAAGLVAWAAAWVGAPGWPMLVAATAAALAGAAAARWLLPAASGELRWDTSQWSWQPRDGQMPVVGPVAVMIDLGPWMLLRMRPIGAAALWLPVGEQHAGAAWRALRNALYAGPAAAPAAGAIE